MSSLVKSLPGLSKPTKRRAPVAPVRDTKKEEQERVRSREKARQKAAAAKGQQSTVLTSDFNSVINRPSAKVKLGGQ